MIARVDTMSLARAERADFAEFLASLTPEQWNAPTLCGGWQVRDVVAHVYSYEDLGFGGLAARFVTAGLDIDRINDRALGDYVGMGAKQLLARARDHVQPKGLTARFGGRIALTDGMIHQQDVRRPLGRPRAIPPDRLVAALGTARNAPTLGARKRIRELTLTATDLDWTTGTGPLVTGPAEALLMAIAGRRGVTSELSGPGLATLTERIEGIDG